MLRNSLLKKDAISEVTIAFKLHSYEDKENVTQSVYQLNYTAYYIKKNLEVSVITPLLDMIESYKTNGMKWSGNKCFQ